MGTTCQTRRDGGCAAPAVYTAALECTECGPVRIAYCEYHAARVIPDIGRGDVRHTGRVSVPRRRRCDGAGRLAVTDVTDTDGRHAGWADRWASRDDAYRAAVQKYVRTGLLADKDAVTALVDLATPSGWEPWASILADPPAAPRQPRMVTMRARTFWLLTSAAAVTPAAAAEAIRYLH